MEINETILISGAERFSNYSGYGSSFTWNGSHSDNSPWYVCTEFSKNFRHVFFGIFLDFFLDFYTIFWDFL